MTKGYEFEINVSGLVLETHTRSKSYIIVAYTEQEAVAQAEDSFRQDFPDCAIKNLEIAAQYDLE